MDSEMSHQKNNHDFDVKLDADSALAGNLEVEKFEQDTIHLTDNERFFPELVWERVLNNIKEKDHVENCSNSSLYFGKLLQEERQRTVVLPQVFGILANRYANLENKDESYKETNLDSIPWKRPENNSEAHQMTGIWKCRLVSKSFNKAIQQVFEDKQAGHYAWIRDILHRNSPLFKLAVNGFGKRDAEVQTFLKHFENSQVNPFLGRSVRIEYEDDLDTAENETLRNDCLEMARKYGHHIWYLNFRHLGYGMHTNIFYEWLQEMVKLLPNLKVLWVEQITLLRFFTRTNVQLLASLEQQIVHSPFPRLANLEYLETAFLPTIMFNHILHQNGHVVKLDVSHTGVHDQYYAIFGNILPNLSELSLEICSLEDFEVFEKCPFPLSLTKVQILFKKNCPFLPWSRIFGALESKLDTSLCTELGICMPEPTTPVERELILKESLTYRLGFSNLEKVSIYDEIPFGLDFLLLSKNSLHELTISDWGDDDEYPSFVDEQFIKFLGYRDSNIQDSNISDELPRLKLVSIVECHDYNFYKLWSQKKCFVKSLE